MMEQASPGIDDYVKDTKLPMRKILERFLAIAPPSEAAKFLLQVASPTDTQGVREDAYLVGINRK